LHPLPIPGENKGKANGGFVRFATGWNYFLKYAIVLPNNLTAAGIIIQYWRPDLNVAIFIITFTVAIVAVNVFLHLSKLSVETAFLI
jgi:amino acid transporter